jgi:hypothetical protein
MSKNKRHVETLFNTPLFSRPTEGGWDQIDLGCLHYYDVDWVFPSMQQFNGCGVTIDYVGKNEMTFSLYTKEDGKEIEQWQHRSFLDIPEFRDNIFTQCAIKHQEVQ